MEDIFVRLVLSRSLDRVLSVPLPPVVVLQDLTIDHERTSGGAGGARGRGRCCRLPAGVLADAAALSVVAFRVLRRPVTLGDGVIDVHRSLPITTPLGTLKKWLHLAGGCKIQVALLCKIENWCMRVWLQNGGCCNIQVLHLAGTGVDMYGKTPNALISSFKES